MSAVVTAEMRSHTVRRDVNSRLVKSGVRICSRCKRVKPLRAFGPRKAMTDGYRSSCRACDAQSAAEYRAANPERVRETRRHFYDRHAARMRQRTRDYYAAHTEERLEYIRRYRVEHADEIRDQQRRYRSENAESCRESYRKWHAANPDKVKANYQRRRALKMSATVEPFSTTDLIAHWLDAGYLMTTDDRFLCVYCGSAPAEHDDHAHPLAKGGEHSVWNLVPSCAPCNLSKNDRLPLEWIAERSPGIRRWLKAQGAL